MAKPTPPAARALPIGDRRRGTTAVLVGGTVVSMAAAFGPLWVARGGVLVAIAAAVTTSVLAWREVAAERRAHAAAMLAATKAHGESLRIERSHNAGVLQVVTERNSAAMAEISRQQSAVAQLHGEISSLKGDRAALTSEITRREAVISELRTTVRTREAELATAQADTDEARAAADQAGAAAAEARAAADAAGLIADRARAAAAAAAAEAAEAVRLAQSSEEEAEVHTMPRRVLTDYEGQPRRASGAGGADLPTVVDLDPNGLDRGPERRADWHEPVLPNYEEDRRLA